jgi:hypothetical protein
VFSYKISACTTLLFHAGYMLHPVLLNLLILLIFTYSNNCEAPHAIFSSLRHFLFFGPNIPLNILFSNTFSHEPSFHVKDHASHPYKTAGKIIALYTKYISLILNFFNTMYTKATKILLFLKCNVMQSGKRQHMNAHPSLDSCRSYDQCDPMSHC